MYQLLSALVIIILSFHEKSNSDFGIHVSCTNTSVVVQWLGFLAFKLLYHVIIVITRVQCPESREHNIDIYSSAVNARVRTPATEIASSFCHFATLHFALWHCVQYVCAQRKEEIKSPIGTWHYCNGKMLVLMKCNWVSLSLYFLFLSTRETGRLLCHCSF